MAFGRTSTNIDILATDRTGRAIASARSNLTGLNRTARNLMGTFGVGLGAGFIGISLIKDAATLNIEFEKATREVNSLLNLSGPGFKQLQDDIRGVAAAVGTDLIDATHAAYQAISAGVKREDLVGFLKSASRAGIAGLSTTEQAVDVLTSVLNAYKNTNLSAARASDILFSTVKDGKTTFSELADSMYIAAPIAATVGISFEELAASVATITKVTNNTGVAMTQVKGAIVALLKPTEDMAKILSAIGVESGAALIRSKGFAGALGVVRKEAERSNISLTKAFGRIEGYNGLLNVTGDSAADFAAAYSNAINSIGASTAAFRENNQTFARSTERVKSAWQAMVTSIRESGPAIVVMDNLASSMNRVTAAADEPSLGRWTSAIASFTFVGTVAQKSIEAMGKAKEIDAMKAQKAAAANNAMADAIKNVSAAAAASNPASEPPLSQSQPADGAKPTEKKVLAADSYEMNRLNDLIRQYSEIKATPAQNMEVLRTEIKDLQSSLRKMADDGNKGTKEWVETYSAAIQKAIKLYRMEQSAARDAEQERQAAARKAEQDRRMAANEAQQHRREALSSIGIGGYASAFTASEAITAPTPAAVNRWKPGHLYQDFIASKSEAPAAANPEAAAAESFRADSKKAVSALQEIRTSFSRVVEEIETLQQQVANAR